MVMEEEVTGVEVVALEKEDEASAIQEVGLEVEVVQIQVLSQNLLFLQVTRSH